MAKKRVGSMALNKIHNYAQKFFLACIFKAICLISVIKFYSQNFCKHGHYCLSKPRPQLQGFATWYKRDLKGQCGLFLPSSPFGSIIQPEAQLVKSMEKLHSSYLFSLAGSDMLFVRMSFFHTCFETAREDNMRKERELPYSFLLYQCSG